MLPNPLRETIIFMTHGRIPLCFIHEREDRFPLHLLDCIAQHLSHPGVDKGRAVVGVDLPNAFLGSFNNAPVTGFAIPQRLFRLPLFGDIAAHRL